MGAPQSAPPQGGSALTEDDEEYEYEYEYHATETEDHCFTLDLTSRNRGGKRLATEIEGHEMPDQSTSAPSTSKLQILDLQSDNPLIKLNNDFYSCAWSTDLGTQLYLTQPGAAETPQRAGNVLDVVGLSRARLIGYPAKLRRRHGEETSIVGDELSGTSAVSAIDIDEDDSANAIDSSNDVQNGGDAVDQQIARFADVRQSSKDPAQKAQAAFLERLSSIKKAKGETDLVPFYGVKRYAPPDNKEEIRESAKPPEVTGGVNTGNQRMPNKRKRRPSISDAPREAEKRVSFMQNSGVTSENGTNAEASEIPSTSIIAALSGNDEASATTPEHGDTGALDRDIAVDPLMIDPLLLETVDHQRQNG